MWQNYFILRPESVNVRTIVFGFAKSLNRPDDFVFFFIAGVKVELSSSEDDVKSDSVKWDCKLILTSCLSFCINCFLILRKASCHHSLARCDLH